MCLPREDEEPRRNAIPLNGLPNGVRDDRHRNGYADHNGHLNGYGGDNGPNNHNGYVNGNGDHNGPHTYNGYVNRYGFGHWMS